MIAFLIGLAIGGTLGLLVAALCQISREADERTERIWQGVRRSMDRVRETCRHCNGNHLDTECNDITVRSVDAQAMEVVIGGWPRPFGARRVWRQRPVA